MDRKIQKLKKMVGKNLHCCKSDILAILGRPSKRSDNEVWFYNRYSWVIFKDVIAFIFEEDKVIDITITEYVLWKEMINIFYYDGQIPEYKVFDCHGQQIHVE